jgi:Reverse transcriptase (RNA-dependent DNA polymerase)
MPENDHLRLTDPDMCWPDELIGDQFLNTEQRAVRREQMGISPIPIRSQPQEGLSGLQPRHSGRDRRPVNHPDNVYGSWNPTQSEQVGDQEFEKLIEGVPAPSEDPGNESSNFVLDPKGKGKEHADYLVKMVQEEGANLIKFLLSAAVSSADAKEKIPDINKVREWHFRDLMHLPKAAQEEWKIACKEELEALCQRNIFKLTNLPKGRKTIGCRWVFDIKSDGHKKARLVAQGFSQVEGIDFNDALHGLKQAGLAW